MSTAFVRRGSAKFASFLVVNPDLGRHGPLEWRHRYLRYHSEKLDHRFSRARQWRSDPPTYRVVAVGHLNPVGPTRHYHK